MVLQLCAKSKKQQLRDLLLLRQQLTRRLQSLLQDLTEILLAHNNLAVAFKPFAAQVQSFCAFMTTVQLQLSVFVFWIVQTRLD